MDEVLRNEALSACERLAVAVYSLMDHGHYQETAALFSEEGTWLRGEDLVTGRAAILAALERRPATQLSRHLVTNILVKIVADHKAEASAIFVPLRGPLRADGTVPMPAIAAAGDLDFKFERGAEGWRISSLVPRFVFKD